MDAYQITAQVSRDYENGWKSSMQIPTFKVSKSCGNLTSAAIVANSIIAPYGDMHVTMLVYDAKTDEYIHAEF